jgi:hypothetical protein
MEFSQAAIKVSGKVDHNSQRAIVALGIVNARRGREADFFSAF